MPPLPRYFVLFTVSYLLAATFYAAVTGNAEFVFYIVFMLILIGVFAHLHRRITLGPGLLWAFTFWGFAHMAGGLVPVPDGWPIEGDQQVLYNLWLIPHRLKYDQAVHFFGFAATTWLCWHGLRRICGGGLQPTLGALTLCAAGGMGFGALNEVVEFIATITLSSTNVGGYVNTGWDLVANLCGCVAAAVVIRIKGR